MKPFLILAAGMLAAGTLSSAPAEAQRWHDGYRGGYGHGYGYHGGYGYRHGGYGRGGYGYRRGYYGGYGYHRGWGGYRGRIVCRYRFGRRHCFRV